MPWWPARGEGDLIHVVVTVHADAGPDGKALQETEAKVPNWLTPTQPLVRPSESQVLRPMMIGLPRVVALKYLKSAEIGRAHV